MLLRWKRLSLEYIGPHAPLSYCLLQSLDHSSLHIMRFQSEGAALKMDWRSLSLSLSDHAIVIISKHYAHERIERQAHWMNILPLKKNLKGQKISMMGWFSNFYDSLPETSKGFENVYGRILKSL